jgi:mono/diheme cytochrome c family protein
MPAFKGTLSDDEIWSVVAYMRAGFPAEEGGTGAVPKP